MGCTFIKNCESSSGVEHHLAKVRVAGSNPVFRSILLKNIPSDVQGMSKHAEVVVPIVIGMLDTQKTLKWWNW